MRRIGAHEAKTHLLPLLDEVESGEVITITRRGIAVAVLAPATDRSPMTTTDAIAGLRAFRRGHPLDGLTLRELVDGGRE